MIQCKSLSRALAPAAVICLGLSALPVQAAGGNSVHVVVLPGTQLFPIAVMRLKGFDKKHDVEINEERVSGVKGMFIRAAKAKFDVMFMTPTNVPTFRSRGVDIVNVSATSGFSHPILVKKGSKYRSWGDLKGATVGLVGSPAGTSTQLFHYQMKKFFGIEQNENKVRFAAPGLLGGMLERGDIDASLMLEPLASKFLATGDYVSIGGLGTVYREKSGRQPPPYINVVMNGKWARENPDVARRFLAALREGLVYLKGHPEVWPELAAEIGIEDPKVVNLLRERVGSALVTDWNQQMIDDQTALIHDMAKVLPSEKLGFPAQVPEGSYTMEYAPR